MKTYDEVIGFDYTNAEEWQDFVKKHILPLHKSISEIIQLRDNIKQLLGNNFLDLSMDNINIKQILLGGVDQNGEYNPNSLAKLYKETLGISINPKEWVAYCKSGIDASKYIKCEFFDTIFLQFINEIKENIDNLLAIFEINVSEINKKDLKEVIDDPDKIVSKLKVIYTLLIHVSASYNYCTFFITNTRCIPRYYIEQAYPKLKDSFEKIVEILNLESKFIPDIKYEEIKRDYTVWGHKEHGFADLVYKLNNAIWKYFSEENYNVGAGSTRVLAPIFGIIGSFPNLKKEYFEKSENLISKNKFSDIKAFYFTMNNNVYLEMYSGDSKNFICNGSTTIIELLGAISPELFLGIRHLTIENNPRFQYEIKKVGYVKSLYLQHRG